MIKNIVKRGSKAELLFTHCGRRGHNASSCESVGQKLLSLLRKKTFCDSVTRLFEDELQNQKPFGGHWSLLEEPQKKHREQILCSHFPHLSGSGCFTVLWSLWAQWHRASLPAQMDAPRPPMWRWPGLSVRLEVAEAQSILWWKGRRLWGPQSSSCGPFQSHPILGSYRLQIARQCRRRKVSGRLGARGVDGGEGRLPPIAVMESSIRGIPTFRKWAGTWKTSLQKTITFAGVWSWSSAMLCLIVQVKLFDALCRHSKTFTICLR